MTQPSSEIWKSKPIPPSHLPSGFCAPLAAEAALVSHPPPWLPGCLSLSRLVCRTWAAPPSGKHLSRTPPWPGLLRTFSFFLSSVGSFPPFQSRVPGDAVLIPLLWPCTLPGTHPAGAPSITDPGLEAPIAAAGHLQLRPAGNPTCTRPGWLVIHYLLI